MWKPSKARILSHSTVRSLSPNKEWQKLFPLAFLPSPLFVWSALANSQSAPALSRGTKAVSLHFLPHHCVLYGLCRGWNHCAAIDPGSSGTWIWWWLFHDLNINSIVSPHLETSVMSVVTYVLNIINVLKRIKTSWRLKIIMRLI